MRIDKVTITGIDDKVTQAQIKLLSDCFPFVEFGILHSPKRQGTERYPSKDRITQMLHLSTCFGVSFSAHLCGDYTKNIFEKNDFEVFKSLKNFNRVQLNYTFKKEINSEFINFLKTTPYKIILQSNESNHRYIDLLFQEYYNMYSEIPKNLQVLHDSSGGKGLLIETIKPPYQKIYTGYAGGISPYNVKKVVSQINDSNPKYDNVWIDMESGVRTHNQFDFSKAWQVLKIVKDNRF